MDRHPVPQGGSESGTRTVKRSAERFVPPDYSYTHAPQSDGSGVEQLLESKQGYIVGHLEGKLLRLNTDGHILTVAPPRSGKGVSCVIPNLLDHPGSAFVVDIRGETVSRTADARLLMGQDVVVLDPYQVTGGRWGYDSFNPLDVLRPGAPGFEQQIKRVSQAILFDPEGRSSKEPIWDNATLLALTGALTYIKTCLPPARQTLLELGRLFSLQSDRRAAIAEEITRAAHNGGVYAQSLDVFIEFLTTGSDKTRIPDNTVIQLMTLLGWVGHQEFAPLLSRSTFSFDNLQTKPTTVYLVLPEEYIKGCEVWVRLLFNAALFQLREVNSVFGVASVDLDQARRVLFLLDEFPAFGRLQPVEDGLATVAGRGATLWLFIQNIAQLDKIYGEHSARQIVGNASLVQAFNSNEIHELEYFSRVVGEEMFDVQSVTIGTNTSTGGSKGTGRTLTIGNSESLSRGTNRSTSRGESVTVTESINEQRTRGSGDSVSHGVSEQTGYGRTTGTATNRGSGGGDGTSASASSGQGGEYTTLDSIGIDWPSWQNKNRNQQWGKSYSRNWSQGVTESIGHAENRSRSTNSQRTHSTNESATTGSSQSVSRGTTHQETHGESEQHTRGTSQSEAESTNENENWSKGENVSFSVKAEQRKIATPRQLRRDMSHGAQLLVLRGHYAFLAPRAAYFERDAASFRFPELALLSGSANWREVWTMAQRGLPRLSSDGFDKLKVTGLRDLLDATVTPSAQHQGRDLVVDMTVRLESVRRIHSRIEQAALEFEKHRDSLLGFFDFAMRFARTFSLSVDQGAVLQLQDDRQDGLSSAELQAISIFENSVLMTELDSLVSDLDDADARWLLQHYDEPFSRAMTAVQKAAIGVRAKWKEAALVEEAMNGLVRDVEHCMGNALVGAAKANIERRR